MARSDRVSKSVRCLHHLTVLLIIALSGCSTLPNGHRWGADATLRPGWDRVRSAAADASRDPWVWGPLIGAAAFQIDSWDRRTSDWAREHTPVFGSERSAAQWSDDLRTASIIAYGITVAATPGGDDPGEWLIAKAKGVMVQAGAVGATALATGKLKTSTQRERPNGRSDQSFPSGHTSLSAVHTRLAAENLQAIAVSPGTRRLLDAGLAATPIATGWARIEAGKHFPSDTLVGMALGNFLASFVSDAFLGLENAGDTVALEVTPQGAILQWNWRF